MSVRTWQLPTTLGALTKLVYAGDPCIADLCSALSIDTVSGLSGSIPTEIERLTLLTILYEMPTPSCLPCSHQSDMALAEPHRTSSNGRVCKRPTSAADRRRADRCGTSLGVANAHQSAGLSGPIPTEMMRCTNLTYMCAALAVALCLIASYSYLRETKLSGDIVPLINNSPNILQLHIWVRADALLRTMLTHRRTRASVATSQSSAFLYRRSWCLTPSLRASYLSLLGALQGRPHALSPAATQFSMQSARTYAYQLR